MLELPRLRCLVTIAFALCALLALHPSPAAADNHVDRRVTAIPAATLLAEPPAKLVDPRRQRVALAYVRYRRPLFFIWAFSQIGVFLWLWSSGRAAQLRDALRRRIHRPFALRFVYATALGTIGGLAALPASLAQYRLGLAYDLSHQTFGLWLRDGIARVTVDAILAALIVAAIMSLADRTRLWYLYSIGFVLVFGLFVSYVYPFTIAPLFNDFHRLGAQDRMAQPLEALAIQVDQPFAPFYVIDFTGRSSVAEAQIIGFGPAERIVLSNTLLDNATEGEIAFLAARELASIKRGDVLRRTIVAILLFIFAVALAVVASDRVKFRRDDDPLARLALLAAFLGIALLVVLPIYDGFGRVVAAKEDAFALEMTGNRAAAVRTWVRLDEEWLAPLCTSRPLHWYFDPTPNYGTRIATIQGRPDPCP